jgi:PhzF family phenazine biosynthesis protein
VGKAQVDAFTSTPFAGNPAAVVLVPAEAHRVADELTHGLGAFRDEVLQAIAAEMRHSETAFLATRPPGEDFAHATDFHLRWFTPKVEVPLCGHVRAPPPPPPPMSPRCTLRVCV